MTPPFGRPSTRSAAAEGILGAGRTITEAAAKGEVDVALLRDLHLLTAKPFIYVFNVDEGALGDAALAASLAESVRPARAIVLCAQIEAEVAGLDAADAAELLLSYGQEESGLEQLVHVGFATLGLQTFLTAGPKEARAWTIHIGDTAPKAAGVIHTDFERGFIKAEVISFEDLMEAGSVAARAPPDGRGWRARTMSCATGTSSSSVSTRDDPEISRSGAHPALESAQAGCRRLSARVVPPLCFESGPQPRPKTAAGVQGGLGAGMAEVPPAVTTSQPPAIGRWRRSGGMSWKLVDRHCASLSSRGCVAQGFDRCVGEVDGAASELIDDGAPWAVGCVVVSECPVEAKRL